MSEEKLNSLFNEDLDGYVAYCHLVDKEVSTLEKYANEMGYKIDSALSTSNALTTIVV